MYPPKFDYYRAMSPTEATTLQQAHSGKFIAGGHSLIPLMKMRLNDPGVLIDIGRIPELQGIHKADGRYHIGALTTHATLAAQPDRTFPDALKHAAAIIGDPQVRSRGTIGGNIAHADPAADLPTVLLALQATIHTTGPHGPRTIPAADFFTGLFETALQEDELITAVSLPTEPTETGSAYTKLFNPASRYAMVAACAQLTVNLTGHCTTASVAIGGLTPKATAAPSVATALIGHKLTDETIAAAAQTIHQDLDDDILSDIHASSDYRRQMAPVFVERALHLAAHRAGWVARLQKHTQEVAHDLLSEIERKLQT